jgi:hypothetical protein
LEKSKVSNPLIAVIRLYLSKEEENFEEILKESNSSKENEVLVFAKIIELSELELSKRKSIKVTWECWESNRF